MMNKKVTVEEFSSFLGEQIDLAMREKNHTKSNICKQVKSALLRASAASDKERTENILKVKLSAIKAESDMWIEVNEESLFDNTLKQIEYLEELMNSVE